jgi:hypothetical protein
LTIKINKTRNKAEVSSVIQHLCLVIMFEQRRKEKKRASTVSGIVLPVSESSETKINQNSTCQEKESKVKERIKDFILL